MDILDIKILSTLLHDCRKSDRQIGRELKISGNAIGSRINKMIKNGIIQKFCLRIEPALLGLDMFYVVVNSQNQKEIIKNVKLVGMPFVNVPCIGGITVIGIVVKEELQKKIELLQTLMRDVRVISIFQANSEKIIHDLTRTDLQIIEQLIEDPRQRIDVLGNKTNVSSKTIQRTLEKLEKNELIQFTLVYDPKKIEGFLPYAVVTITKENVTKMLKKLSKQFSGKFLMKPFLAKNQIVLFLFSDNIYEMDSVVEKIAAIQGVDATELFIPKGILMPDVWLKSKVKELIKSEKLHIR